MYGNSLDGFWENSFIRTTTDIRAMTMIMAFNLRQHSQAYAELSIHVDV